MQPILTLQRPAPSYSTLPSTPVDKCHPQETTPKLPRRERLASFSRLIASESFLEFLPDKAKCESRRKLRPLAVKAPPSICISPSSNSHYEEWLTERNAFLNTGEGCFPANRLPFSPSLFSCRSPNYLSPNYKQPTPTKSPLYNATERQSSFLGRGSFGNVTLCIYKGSKYALKVTRSNASSIGEKNLLKIRHPHLVTILHIAHVSDQTFICMDFAGHCNLQQVLDTKSELDFPRRLSFCIQVISGLRHCHQHQIVHGDVKPANVIVSPYGICKLGDFGQSICLDSASSAEPDLPSEIVGTAAYAAPEVLRGARPSQASDMYSFAILLWQVQTREIPFAGEHPHVIIYKVAHYGCRPTFIEDGTGVSNSYSEITRSCWENEPTKRLNAIEASNALQKLMQLIKQYNK